MAGTIGAIFNGALQLGSALGISIVGSIEVSVEATHGGPTSYAGRAAAFWFLLGVVGVELVSMLVFYRISREAAAATYPESDRKAVVEIDNEKVVQSGETSLDGERTPAVEQPQLIVDEVTKGRIPVVVTGTTNV